MLSKYTSDPLHALVRSLSKSEKRFFAIYAGRQNKGEQKALRLFRALGRQKKFRSDLFLKRNPDISRDQLPNMKVYLYEEVLRSLRMGAPAGDGDQALSLWIDAARILYQRCLYADSLRLITKAKSLALQGKRDTRLIEILELEKEVSRMTLGTDHLKQLEEAIRESDEVLERIRKTQSFTNLSLEMSAYYLRAGFVKSRDDEAKVIRYFQRKLPRYDLKRIGFYEKVCLHLAFTGYYFFLQRFEQGHSEARKCVELFRTHPAEKRSLTDHYIRALNNLLVAQNKMHLTEAFSETLRELISLKRDKSMPLSADQNLHLFKAIYIHEINRHYMLGEFRSGTRIVHRLRKELQRFIPLLDKHSVLLLYYKIACLYFGASQFREALKWLNPIINDTEPDVREDLQRFARILALISHYEAGQSELLEFRVRSLYRFLLRRGGSLTRYDALILRFLRRLPNISNDSQLRAHFLDLRKKLESLKKHRFERRSFLYFDIISWLESRIEGRPVEEVIRKKVRAGN